MTGASTQVNHHHDEDDEEGRDQFPATTTTTTNEQPLPQGIHTPVMLDMTLITNAARPGPPSVATTQLASDVGSTVGGSKDAFLKSITFYKKNGNKDTENKDNVNNGNTTEPSWALRLQSGTEKAKGVILRRTVTRPRLVVDAVAGSIAFSRIQQGDYLRSINGKKLGPSMMNPDLAMEKMESCLEKDGYLHLETSNKELGDDILVQATVIKPRPDMTLEEMGMVVWFWGFLCIKSIKEDSIFEKTALKWTDQITAINDIDCKEMQPEQFAKAVKELPYDVTLTVLRRKQRWIGDHK